MGRAGGVTGLDGWGERSIQERPSGVLKWARKDGWEHRATKVRE